MLKTSAQNKGVFQAQQADITALHDEQCFAFQKLRETCMDGPERWRGAWHRDRQVTLTHRCKGSSLERSSLMRNA
jgi:hypothetical protein